VTEPTATELIKTVGSTKLPDMVGLSKTATSMLSLADTLEIESDEDFQAAGVDLQAITQRHKDVEAMRVTITGPLNQALRATNALFKTPLDRLELAGTKFRVKMLAWQERQKAEAARIQRENERIAAEQRARAEAEAKRIRDEAAAVERQKAQEAARLEAEGKAAEAEALRRQTELDLQAQNEHAEAQETIAAIVVAAPPPPVVKAAGFSSSQVCDFDVELAELVKWVAAHVDTHAEYLVYLQPDLVKIRAQIRATGMATRIGGVTPKMVSRSAVRT
jgi:hypothetical protein